jgi:GT2 family glycosyltransferase
VATEVRVSVLIVCHRRVDLLARCLQSLRRNLGDAVSSETIVLFNGTPEADRERVRDLLRGAVTLVSSVNLGFGGGNNRAAAQAQGEYLALLNDDVEVQPGWLEPLVETAERHGDAGAVGSRILHPDGSLQEAGSVVWSDGSSIGVGRGLPPGARRYDYVREVDYVSACSLLVRRSTFEQLGGFDERFFPGYNEDVDLCFGIRRLGQRVLYQPRSVVVHHESQTGSESKTFLILRGRARLREKWGEELARQPEPRPGDPLAVELAIHRARRSPRRLLVVDDRPPTQGMGSGFGRMLEAMRELAGAGYALSLYPTSTADGDRRELQDLGVDVVERDLVSHLASPGCLYDAAIISRPNNFLAARPVRRFLPYAPIIYDAEALFHRRLEREAELLRERDPQTAAARSAEARRTRLLERRIVRDADRAVAVSSVEADFLRSVPGHCPVEVVEGFSRQTMITPYSFGQRQGALLVAGWLAPYPSPNSDGLEWFAEHVLPLVAGRLPWAKVSVTGAGAYEQVGHLEAPGLRFLGHVEDLHGVYARTRVAVVPVRYGAGIKNKAIEALQHGVPVITTSVGAEGIPGAGGPALSVCDDPVAFADRLEALLDDRGAWESARAATADLVSRWREARTRSWPEIVETALKEKTVDRVALRRSY